LYGILGREKHERRLRPRLGSPDCAEELAGLDSLEKGRSADFTSNVIKFRKIILKVIIEHSRDYVDNMAVISNALMLYLDSTVYRECLQVPPDTPVPKKRMTLKRLRKAQRLREEVAQGNDSRSFERAWPGMDLEGVLAVVAIAENIIRKDLGYGKEPEPVPIVLSPPKKEIPNTRKSFKDTVKVPDIAAPEIVELLSPQWIANIRVNSEIHGAVSTAHRSLIADRDSLIKGIHCICIRIMHQV
jgi:hypothetical protein